MLLHPQPRSHPSPQGLEEVRTQLGISEQDPDEPELSMPEPAPLGVDKKAVEKKRVEKVGAKGSTTVPPGRRAGKPFSAPNWPAWPQEATDPLWRPQPAREAPSAHGEVTGRALLSVVPWELSHQALGQAAQGSGGVPIPGGVQEMCRCGTSGHGLAGMGVMG